VRTREDRPGTLSGRVCAVTGGAQGLGWALTEVLAAAGARVHSCDLSEDNLAMAAETLTTAPWAEQVSLTRCDVTSAAEVRHWITGIHDTDGGPDILINNAMYTRWVDVDDMSVAEAERTMRTAFDAMVYTVTTALPLMRQARYGHIVNIGSSAGRIYVKGPSAAYAAGKAAVEAYTRMLAMELSGLPIHAMLVRPGLITGTDFHRRHVSADRMPRLADLMPSVTPRQTALAIVRGIQRRRRIVDVPSYVSVMIKAYEAMPAILTRLSGIGGSARGDFGETRK
jgi:NAD(P)-dependent dehydrogenase (short-subunit alcohol dehydrogenase family)